MASNGEIISRIANGLKALVKDSHISGRYIINVARTKAKFLMGQKNDEMTLFKEDNLIKNIPCVRLKRVKTKDCGIVEFTLCDKLMKSCEKLPEGIYGKNGAGIFSVLNIDGSINYRYITPRRYADIKKRKYRMEKAGYFYVQDGYLYLPDSDNELVDIAMIVIDLDDADCISECTDSTAAESGCNSKLDLEFICPDRFLDLVVKDTIQEMANFYRTSVVDENPNLDENQKSKTVQ